MKNLFYIMKILFEEVIEFYLNVYDLIQFSQPVFCSNWRIMNFQSSNSSNHITERYLYNFPHVEEEVVKI